MNLRPFFSTLATFALLSLFIFFTPITVRADAGLSRQIIQTTTTEIDQRVVEIKSLKTAKKLSQAFQKLHDLNHYIETNLGDVFYDHIREVLRADPSYTPPTINISLGVEFTTSFWDQKVATAEQSLRNAVEALQGIPSMATLDAQDKAWAWLKTFKDSTDSVLNLYKNLSTLNAVGLFWDLYSDLNTLSENITAVENANLQDINRGLFRQQINKLIAIAKNNITLMKDAKSAMLVYRIDILTLQYNLRNITNYTTAAKTNPLWPLNFNNTVYIFDSTPYTNAIEQLLLDFSAGYFCWDHFQKMYNNIRTEALAEKNQVAINITNSPEPAANKNIYQIDLSTEWDYFENYANNRYTGQDDTHIQVNVEYNTLLTTVSALKDKRQTLSISYWDTTGFARESLETFDEQAAGIIQTNLPGFLGENPYFLGREYAPVFPLGPISSSYEMPNIAPNIALFSYGTYGNSLIRLADAYRVMAEAALKASSNRIYAGSGKPVATFAKSPLSQNQLNIVESNLQALTTQADNLLFHINTRHSLIGELQNTQAQLTLAETKLIQYTKEHWPYLCISSETLELDASTDWDNILIPILLADRDADAGIALAKETIATNLDYIAGQHSANQKINLSSYLLSRMRADQDLLEVINFTVSDYTSLPAFPVEQGYLDFLAQLRWLSTFYSQADLNRVMDLRQEAKDIMGLVYANPSNFNAWMRPENPYCVMPENETAFQDLINSIDLWSDYKMPLVRQGFPGWDSWAKKQLSLYWPATSHTDTTEPNIIHLSPGRNSENVSLYQIIQVQFNETMDSTSLTGDNFTLTANDTLRPQKSRYDKKTNKLYIDAGRMLPNTVYTLSFSNMCRDLAGNSLVPESWSFTTISLPSGTPSGSNIKIGGVVDGGNYTKPVNITISADSLFSAEISANGEKSEPIVSGTTISRRGNYLLTVTTNKDITRTTSFTISIIPENIDVNTANYYETPNLANSVITQSSLGSGIPFFVDGRNYYYNSGQTIHLYDMLTGQDTRLFDTGYYYKSEGGLNAKPSTYCSFLAVSEEFILFVKNTGDEGPGILPENKIFNLFVYNLSSQRTIRVPSQIGFSITSGYIMGDNVVWLDNSTDVPAIYLWNITDNKVSKEVDFPQLQSWQSPTLLGFDNEWLLYKIDDNDTHNYTTNGDSRIRTPNGESLLATNIITAQTRTVVSFDPAHPVRIQDAKLISGRTAYLTYEFSGVNPPSYWEDTCTTSTLSLMHLASGMVRIINTKPHVTDFQMSGTLLYFTERVSPPPFSLSGTTYQTQIKKTVVDLFNYHSQIVSYDISGYHYNLFGDRLISDHDAPRVVPYASEPSSVVITSKDPVANTSDIPANYPITATFSAPLDPATLTGEFISLSRVGDNGAFVESVPIIISYDSVNATITLSHPPLTSGGDYRVVFLGGFLDATGKTFSTPTLWNFTVEDTTGPILLSSSPEAECNCMAPASPIILNFDESPTDSTIAAGLRLFSGTTDVSFTNGGINNGSLTITPETLLAPETKYTLEISAALQDNAGNSALPTSFVFTTTGSAATIPEGSLFVGDPTTMVINKISLPNLTSSQLRQDSVQNMEISPTGNALYILDSSQKLARLEIPSGIRTELTANAATIPVFSADGKHMLYSHDKDGVFGHEIISNTLTGDTPEILLDLSSGRVSTLALSPDNSLLAFTHIENYTSTRLGILDISTKQATFVNDTQALAWAPEGTTLYAIARNQATGYKNTLVELSTTLSLKHIIREIPSPTAWAISPAGEHLALFLNNGIHLIDLSTGYMHQILTCRPANMMSVPRMVWDKDGSSLVFNAAGFNGASMVGLYVLDIATGKTTTLYEIQGGMPGMSMAFKPVAASMPLPVVPTITDQSTESIVSIFIDWSTYPEATNISQYKVYRSESHFSSTLKMTPITITTQTSFFDKTAEQGKFYYYAVTPITASGLERQLVAPTKPFMPGDGDTLNNSWEIQWFNSLTALPSSDPDLDGLNNQAEQREGTNPLRADTDGDGAGDGAEVTYGFNPLIVDIPPLLLTSASPDAEVSKQLMLNTTGGSGSYTWQITGVGQANVDEFGVLTGTSVGEISVIANDNIFIGMSSNPVPINILSAPLAIKQGASVSLQVNGHIQFDGINGSGFYQWLLDDGAPASINTTTTHCTLTATAPSGVFMLTLIDLLVPERTPASTTITIKAIPGDVSGDSLIGLDDLLLCLQNTTGQVPLRNINLQGDINGDSKISIPEAQYILEKLNL